MYEDEYHELNAEIYRQIGYGDGVVDIVDLTRLIRSIVQP